MKRFRWPHIVVGGLALTVAGFAYDLKFAGLPFQDPTPEMQANWLFHKGIASNAILGGIIVFLAGLLWALARLTGKLLQKRG